MKHLRGFTFYAEKFRKFIRIFGLKYDLLLGKFLARKNLGIENYFFEIVLENDF